MSLEPTNVVMECLSFEGVSELVCLHHARASCWVAKVGTPVESGVESSEGEKHPRVNIFFFFL